MSIFTTFSFDIVILLILTISVFTGMYLSLYRQIGLTLCLAIPIILLYFLFDYLFNAYTSLTGLWFNNSKHKYLMNALLVYFLGFIILAFLVYLIYRIFRPSVQKRVINKISRLSRGFGGLLGLVSGYLLCVILVYAVKPLINFDYEQVLTKSLIASENKVISISKLNQYQNVNVEKYHQYQATLALFTGRTALDFYTEFNDYLFILENKNETFENEIHPILSSTSKALIESNLDQDYLEILVKTEGKKLIFEIVLENEKENPSYSLIDNAFVFLKENKEYLKVYYKYLKADIASSSFEDIVEALVNHEDEINAEISNLKKRERFSEGLNACRYYQNNDKFKIHLDDDSEVVDLVSYVDCFESLLKSPELSAYIDKFLRSEDEFSELKKIFKDYQKYQDRMLIQPKNMDFVVSLVLIEEDKNWFEKPLWEEQALIKSYLFDCLSSSEAYGHQLYAQYFFGNYLAASDTYLSFGTDEFQASLVKLDQLVETGTIKQEVAQDFISLFILDADGILADFIKKGIAAPTIFQEIGEIENEYLSAALKEEILRRLTDV